MLNNFSWDEYFMTMAYLVSMKSKDPSTRVGAVIIGPDREIRSTGYNGLPRNISDHDYRYYDREYKLLAGNHAEENAILHCARIGIPTKECIIYTPWIPCSRCAKSIIQAGIVEVIYDINFPGNHQENQADWQRSIEISKELLTEAQVKIREFDRKIIKLEGLYKSRIYEL